MFPAGEDLRLWADAVEGVEQVLAPHFARAEPRQRAMRYLRGLLRSVERKNGWQLAELAGEATPDGMQRLLNTAHWDADQVRDDLQAYMLEHLGNPQAVLVMDETGFLKKGAKSAGVAPQYSGTAATIATCQIGVFLAYATAAGPVLIDREFYLPTAWSSDRARCQEAGIPEEQTTIPKPTVAKQMLDRAFAHGIQAAWVTGDRVYGGDDQLRAWLEERQQPYVLAVPRNQRVGLTASAEQVVARWQTTAWQRLSAGEGRQGARWYDWAWQALECRALPEGWQQWLLARRSISHPDAIAYSFVFAPAAVQREDVVRAAGMRWQVEEGFELAKQEVGLDEYEVRQWQGWYRHIT
jgi:SRSO17 transposase